jgi:ribonuclease P protein component
VIYETTISTVENSAQTAARVSEPKFEQERPCDFKEPPPCGTETVDARLDGGSMPAGTPGRLRFRRTARIKEGRQFSRVRQDGKRLAIGCMIANWCALPRETSSRLGVITSRKIGNAVIRSRARRLLRETFRLHQHEFCPAVELVLIARASIVGKGLPQVEKDFLAIVRRAELSKTASPRNS